MRDYEYRNMNGVNGGYDSDEDWQARRYRSYGSGTSPYPSEYWSERPRYYGYRESHEPGMWDRFKGEAREGWDRIRSTFAGKGPKGYTRSDERIKEDVCEKLYWDPEIDASDIEVTVKAGDVMLAGKVSDRRSKRLAEDLADSVTGVKDVQNGLRIDRGIHAATVPTARSGNGHGHRTRTSR